MKKRMLGVTKLMVVDDLSPEDLAMLQALYSRSAESAEVHLEKVRELGSGKFMSGFYVGYNHKSIADCGSTTMFIENVSLLAAKAIQDWPLYAGQETSTRYIDMSKQRIVDPVSSDRSHFVLNKWMNFYTRSQEQVKATIRAKYPKKPDEKDSTYDNAVTARTFDILRGFLPAGICTQLSWHTNIRQAGDHLIGVTKHPSEEIKELGLELRGLLGEQYPSSGAGLNLATVSGVSDKDTEKRAKALAARERWEQQVADELTYFTYDGESPLEMTFGSNVGEYCGFSDKVAELIKIRPQGCVLPHELTRLGQLNFSFGLDFGSFRDLQRHRNGVVSMPLLTVNHGFEEWYLKELGPLEAEGRDLIEAQTAAIAGLSSDPVVQQYYTALGFKVPCRVTWGLPAAVYVMELRSSKTVHPTLRACVHQMISMFEAKHPDIPLHVDRDVDDWSVRRGLQTITRKQ